MNDVEEHTSIVKKDKANSQCNLTVSLIFLDGVHINLSTFLSF